MVKAIMKNGKVVTVKTGLGVEVIRKMDAFKQFKSINNQFLSVSKAREANKNTKGWEAIVIPA